jgi:hypothetical protein
MDVIVLIEPVQLWPHDDTAAPSLYVTLTRATRAVVVLHHRELPGCGAADPAPGCGWMTYFLYV